MIVAMVGIDAAGKATQAERLMYWFNASVEGLLPARVFSAPDYESPTGKLIKAFFKGDLKVVAQRLLEVAGKETSASGSQPWILQALMCANRLERASDVAGYAYAKERVGQPTLAILDRWTICGEVFGSADGVDEAWIRKQNEAVPMPDLWILIDVSVEEGFKRRPERRDYHETRKDFLERARQKYLEIFNRRDPSCYVVIDGHGSVDEVSVKIEQAYSRRRRELDDAREAFFRKEFQRSVGVG